MIQIALIDLSGTVHIGDRPIEGTVEACEKLQGNNINVQFVTNTTKVSRVTLSDQLQSIGFTDHWKQKIVTSTIAARNLLRQKKGMAYALVEEDLLAEDLADVTTVNPEEANCVLIGLAPSQFNYHRLNEAFRLLLKLQQQQQQQTDELPLLIAIHKAQYFRDGDGELSLGPGGFVSCLEEATGISAAIVGKPSPSFFRNAIGKIEKKYDNVVMIGDDILQDIGGAQSAGIGHTILVRTGKYRNGDETRKGITPTHVANSIVEAVEYILSYNQQQSAN